jgi:hypothetical protein
MTQLPANMAELQRRIEKILAEGWHGVGQARDHSAHLARYLATELHAQGYCRLERK